MRRLLLAILLAITTHFTYAQSGIYYRSSQLSNSLISCICQDKAGYIWVGTDYGLNRFDGYRFVKYFHKEGDESSLRSNTIVSIFCDSQGQLWIGSSHGLQRYVYDTDSFEDYAFDNGNAPRVNDIIETQDGSLLIGTAGYGLYKKEKDKDKLVLQKNYSQNASDMYFSHVFEDARGNFWKCNDHMVSFRSKSGKYANFATTAGTPSDFLDFNGMTMVVCRDNILVYENGRMRDDYFDTSEMAGYKIEYRTAFKDNKGNLYIGSRGNGLFWVPAGTRKLVRYNYSVRGFDSHTARVWAVTGDRDGNLWIGCQHKGIVMIPSRKPQFSAWRFSDQNIDVGTFVSSVCEGEDGITWCTVQNMGVYGFDSTGKIKAHPSSPDGVQYIYRSSGGGNYWLGTTHGAYLYDPKTGSSRLISDYRCDSYNNITDDKNGHIYFSAFGKGLVMHNRETGVNRVFSMNNKEARTGKLCNDWIMELSTDRNGMVWIATSSGVCCYDPASDSFKPFGWDVILDNVKCNMTCATSGGDIIIGTDNGVYIWLRKTNKVERFKNSQALNNLLISYIIEDNDRNIWCSTSMGIWQYNINTKQWLSYVNGSGLYSHEYVFGAGMHTDKELIFFASGDGLTAFTPQQVRDAQSSMGKLMLTGFYLGEKSVNTLTESDDNRIMDNAINEEDHFYVSYLESSITLEFSLLNYADAANTIFEYRFDDQEEWSRTDVGQNSINFSHLQSGTYTLHVRAINNGVVSEEKIYTIDVASPWYNSTLAWIIYLLVLGGLGYAGVIFYRRHMSQQLEEDKMKFLINATHDIRSPLTLIMSPLAKLRETVKLCDDEGISEDALRKKVGSMNFELDVIERNSQRILSLVNQILDVRKIDKQQMHLNCRETDMREFIDIIYKVYEYAAKEHEIDFRFEVEDEDEPIMAWIDPVQFDKVVSNLISNSFKYTFDRGSIVVSLSRGHDDNPNSVMADYVEIVVSDTGVGMKNDVLQHVFDRFYQGKDNLSNHIEGTGIGLNLCKMIVDMHHGTITAANREDGVNGSVFTVRLPLGNSHLLESEICMSEEQDAVIHVKMKQTPRSNCRLLLVDDDNEMCEYISGELSAHYRFTICHNGKDAIKELLTNPYDVVVTDLMMPEMDGFTLLRLIKSNANISHIPVILLTSKSDVNYRLEGLEKGADAYLTKPFQMDELRLTIDNLIANHLRLKGKFSGAQQPTDMVESIEVKGNDEQLMERIMKSINAHLSDSDYGVDIMCSEVGISRAHLHRKMKELTGIPVSEFIRNIRLEQAARLLKEQKLNITQVAYTVGFSSHGYFSTVFRKHFGVSPREFVERLQ